jgi:catechol 2,3-dioxygenase-like lactoylglutathione lyase family enzyme
MPPLNPAVRHRTREETMPRSIASLTLLVRDYDEAIAFFTGALRFTLVEDTPLGGGKRWVLVAPPDATGASLLLARAATPETAGSHRQSDGRPCVPVPSDQRLLE